MGINIFLLSLFLQVTPVGLAWDSNPENNLVGYNVYRSFQTATAYSRLTGNPVNQTTYQDTTVQEGDTYYYVVTAVNTLGLESGYSNEIEVAIATTPPPDPDPQPDPPVAFEVLLEAEAFAVIGGAFTIVQDATASGGAYLVPISASSTPTIPRNEASLPVNLPSRQNYTWWIRILGSDTGHDSVWAGFITNQRNAFNTVWGEWEWVKGLDDLRSAGAVDFILGRREAGTQIDAIYISSNPLAIPPDPGQQPISPPDPEPDPPDPPTNLTIVAIQALINLIDTNLARIDRDCSVNWDLAQNNEVANIRALVKPENATAALALDRETVAIENLCGTITSLRDNLRRQARVLEERER